MLTRSVSLLATLFLATFIIGCAPSVPEKKHVAAEGVVTYNGKGQKDIQVTFTPDGKEGKGNIASAMTKEDGKFSTNALEPGKYNVVFIYNPPPSKDRVQKKQVEGSIDTDAALKEEAAKIKIPEWYTKNPFVVDVPSTKEFKFDIVSPKTDE